MAPPTYDLAYFKDKIPANLPVATVGPVVGWATHDSTSTVSPYVLWIGIIAVLVLLGYMSYQMLGRVEGSDK